MKLIFNTLALLIITAALPAQSPSLEEVVQYRNSLRALVQEAAEDRAEWEQAIRDQDFSRIRQTYDAFFQSSKKAYETLLETPATEGDPGYRDACYEYALIMFMGAEGRVQHITRIALDDERTEGEIKRMEEEWEFYWNNETYADKQVEIAEYELFSRFSAESSKTILCGAVKAVLRESETGFIKYKGAPTESTIEGASAFTASSLMPGAIKGVWFSGEYHHNFLVFTFFEDASREKALEFYNALCIDFVSCPWQGWKRDVYRPEFGNNNPPDLKWLSCKTPDASVQVRVVMGKPRGLDVYRVQIRFDTPAQ